MIFVLLLLFSPITGYANHVPVGEQAMMCSCSFRYGLMTEQTKKACDAGSAGCDPSSSANYCWYQSFAKDSATGKITPTYSFHYGEGEEDNLFATGRDTFTYGIGKEESDLEVKDDHILNKQSGNQKCYLWPDSAFKGKNTYVIEEHADWPIDVNGSDVHACLPKDVLGHELYIFQSAYANGGAGKIVLVSNCTAKPYTVHVVDVEGEEPPGRSDLNIARLNKLGDGAGAAADVQRIVGRMIAVALSIIGSIAVAIFVAGGFLVMTAAGNADRQKKGVEMLVWGALGVIVILSSYALAELVFNVFA